MSAKPVLSEEDPRIAVDERKRKRMESNRESARRSRMRKQLRIGDLVNEAARLKNENSKIEMQINILMLQYPRVESDNTILKTQVIELTDRLQSLNSVLRFVEEFSGMAMDIPEVPDPMLKPWQLPCPTQPLIASGNTFQ